MKRRHLSLAAVVLSCTILPTIVPATSVQAADDVLTVIPDNAMAVAVLNRIDQTQGKIAKLVRTLKVPGGEMMVAMMTGAVSSFADKAHVDKDGDIAVAVMPGVDFGAPVVLLLVPTTDYDAMLEKLDGKQVEGNIARLTLEGARYLATEKKGYAVLAKDADPATFEATLRATGGAARALASLDEWRTKQDAYAIAMPGGIKFAQQNILQGLAAMKQQIEQAGEQGQMAAAGLGIYEKMFKSLDKEFSHVAAGAQVQDDGAIRLVSRWLLAPGGVLAELAKKAEPVQQNLLAGLPKGEFFLAGGAVFPQGLYEPLMDLSFEMMKMYPGGEGISEDDVRKLTEMSIGFMKEVKSMGMRFGVARSGEPLYSSVLIAFQVDDAERYLKQYKRLMRKMIALGKQTDNKLLTSYTAEPMEIKGKPGMKVTVDMEIFMGEQPPEAKMMFEAMLGDSSKMDVYLVAANPTTVLGAYISQEQLKLAMKAVDDEKLQMAAQKDVGSTLAMLPDDVQFVGLWSVRGTFQFARAMVSSMMPEAAAEMPDFPKAPPIGFAGKLSPAGLETELVIPAEVLQATAKLIQDGTEGGAPQLD